MSSLLTVSAPEIISAWADRVRTPGIAHALDLAAEEADWFRLGQIMRLGRQTAYERLANLFLELEYRLSARGLVTDGAFPMPLTQEMISDALGLSVVHVNRTVQEMRRQGVIALRHGRLAIRDMPAPKNAGEFLPPMVSRGD